ncbi:MAG: hypothetical protein ABL907_19610 [Hyphomicrobium sp.]
MVKAHVVIREIGREKPDYSLLFDFPELPRIGDYISVYRPDAKHTEDLVVRHVWWHLDYPDDGIGIHKSGREPVGKAREVFVECDQAIGPYARDRWRSTLLAAKDRGVEVVEFGIARFSVTEADLANVGKGKY